MFRDEHGKMGNMGQMGQTWGRHCERLACLQVASSIFFFPPLANLQPLDGTSRRTNQPPSLPLYLFSLLPRLVGPTAKSIGRRFGQLGRSGKLSLAGIGLD